MERVEAIFSESFDEVREQVETGERWKISVPGKPIFAQFCGEANIQPGRLKNLYISKAIERGSLVFEDILRILRDFSEAG